MACRNVPSYQYAEKPDAGPAARWESLHPGSHRRNEEAHPGQTGRSDSSPQRKQALSASTWRKTERTLTGSYAPERPSDGRCGPFWSGRFAEWTLWLRAGCFPGEHAQQPAVASLLVERHRSHKYRPTGRPLGRKRALRGETVQQPPRQPYGIGPQPSTWQNCRGPAALVAEAR